MSESIQNILKAHFSVREEKADHHYRTELPNIIFDLPLDAFEFKLYAFIKKIAGDSNGCWKSNPNISKDIDISVTKIKDSLKVLASAFELLGGQALITIIERKKPDGSPDSNLIIINNIWRTNGDHFRKDKQKEGGSPNDGGVGRQKTEGGSPNDHKEEPSKKNPLRNDDDGMKASPSIIKLRFLNGKEQFITIQDIYSLAVLKRKDWLVSEIEYAFEKLRTYESERISDLSSLCDKIIQNKSKADRAEKFANKSKKQEQTRPSHENIPVQPQENLKRWGDIMPELNK